jgi:hypothetical protein
MGLQGQATAESRVSRVKCPSKLCCRDLCWEEWSLRLCLPTYTLSHLRHCLKPQCCCCCNSHITHHHSHLQPPLSLACNVCGVEATKGSHGVKQSLQTTTSCRGLALVGEQRQETETPMACRAGLQHANCSNHNLLT